MSIDRRDDNTKQSTPESATEQVREELYKGRIQEDEENPTQSDNPIKQSILLRASVLHFIFLLMALAAVGMVGWLQYGPDARSLQEQATHYSFRNEILEAARGDVLSEDYRTMATSIVYYDLRLDLSAPGLTDELFNKNIEQLSVQLSEFFKDKSAIAYQHDITKARNEKKRYYRVTPKRVDYLELQHIKKFAILNLPPNVGGFIPQEIGRRVNPYGELAGRTIGFINSVGRKVGIDGAYDDYLRGRNGVTVKQKISGDFWIPVNSPLNIEPENGMDVVSTINIELQEIAQNALKHRLVEEDADWGTVIVMDVPTGQVRAIANATRVKATNSVVEDYNYAIGMSMEPGSTFKLVGLMALLDDAKMPFERMVNTGGGREKIGYATVVDSRSGGYGTLSLREVFEHSSNIGMAKTIMESYGSRPSKFIDYIRGLKLDKPLGVSLPGEAVPTVRHPSDKRGWDGMTLTMMSYGYAVQMTPLQTLTLYNAIANGGRMVKPQFVKELRKNGVKVKDFPTETMVEKVASEQTIRQVRYAMEGVVERGTGKMLKNDRYTVAAKTGTAQIAMGRSGYKTSTGAKHYLASLAGYFPADNPRYSVIVALKTFYTPGDKKHYYGGSLSGPLFKEVADHIYNYDFNLQKTRVSDNQQGSEGARLTASAGSAESLNNLMRALGENYRATSVDGMAAIDSGRMHSAAVKIDSVNMPDVRGMALNEALDMLYTKGYLVRVEGRGRIREQVLQRDTVSRRECVVLKLK